MQNFVVEVVNVSKAQQGTAGAISLACTRHTYAYKIAHNCKMLDFGKDCITMANSHKSMLLHMLKQLQTFRKQ